MSASEAPDGPEALHTSPLGGPPRRPTVRLMLSHPAHLLSFGGGSGLSPFMPGTVGTLWGWLVYAVLDDWWGRGPMADAYWALLLAVGWLVGCWACTRTAQALRVAEGVRGLAFVLLGIIAAVAVVAVVWGWGAGQYPYLLEASLTIEQAAGAGRFRVAAEVDGATRWQLLRYVIIPHLMPAIVVMTLLSTFWTFNNFVYVWLTTAGGPGLYTNVMATDVYIKAFIDGRMGYSSAIGVVMAALMTAAMATNNSTRMTVRTRSVTTKGMAPRKVSPIGISLASPLMMKRFIPTGGVIRPTSTTISTRMPNHRPKSSGDMPKSRPAITG